MIKVKDLNGASVQNLYRTPNGMLVVVDEHELQRHLIQKQKIEDQNKIIDDQKKSIDMLNSKIDKLTELVNKFISE